MSLIDKVRIAKAAMALNVHDEGFRAVATELRLHPDDYAELLREVRTIARPWNMPPLAGIPVVVDVDAPRLPRKGTL